MGFTVDFSPQALKDLHAAVSEIAKDSPERAESFGLELVAKTDVLERFPFSGNLVPEFGDERIRELHHRPYRIVYEVKRDDTLVVILRYWHTSRGYLKK